MSGLCLKMGRSIWIHEEIPVVCNKVGSSNKKGDVYFSLFKFIEGAPFKYVRVWFYQTWRVSLVNATLEYFQGRYKVIVKEEIELKKVKGTKRHMRLDYEGAGYKLTLHL